RCRSCLHDLKEMRFPVRGGHTGAMGGPSHEGWVDRQTRDATERGDFDDLPGAGRPLRLLEDRDTDWWVKGMIAGAARETAAALTPALQVRREAAGYPDSLADETSEANVRELLRDCNRRVLEVRRRPSFGRHSPPIAPTVDV